MVTPSNDYDEFKKLVKDIANELIGRAQQKTMATLHMPNWYAGITGQDDEDGDGKADRAKSHPEQIGNWTEIDVFDHELAKAVEDELHERGFQGGGNRGNMKLNPTIVYLQNRLHSKTEAFFKSSQ